mmetsp:Transcript_30702/g.46461  ORF Transcript_30702/g.46461 Transcript_30702/m.46461 type:complete len:156 (+) Transcript_30702:1353-1820(+)
MLEQEELILVAIHHQPSLEVERQLIIENRNQKTRMGKKTTAKIRRNQKRAEAHGEAYQYTPPKNAIEEDDGNDAKVKAAEKLKKALSEIESNSEMNSKECRTAKRKAEAIASEESGGCAASDLLAYYEKKNASKKNATQGSDDDKNGNKLENYWQ